MLGPAACTPSRLCADRFVMSKVFTHSLWASESRSAGGNGVGLSWKRLGLSERGVRCALTAGVPRAAPRALGSADASGHAFHARCIISLLSMRLRPRAARRYATLRVPSSSMRYCTIADACTLQRRRPSHGGACRCGYQAQGGESAAMDTARTISGRYALARWLGGASKCIRSRTY